ncbi:MAG: hypothetical protein L3J91_03865, partial [Thermoplasmata archaeon]|nr:hypothetical protein [Thermoplasmata archaeon]
MHRTSVPYGTRTSVVVATAFAVVTALLVPALALGPPGAPATSTMDLTPQNVSWATYPTGGLQVIFPSTLPQVDLVDRANSSLGAALQVDAILELQPGGLPHPTIVAAAFPTQL